MLRPYIVTYCFPDGNGCVDYSWEEYHAESEEQVIKIACRDLHVLPSQITKVEQMSTEELLQRP